MELGRFLTDSREGVERGFPGVGKNTYYFEGTIPSSDINKLSLPPSVSLYRGHRPQDIETLVDQIKDGDFDPAQFYRHLDNLRDDRLVHFEFIGENSRRLPIDLLLPNLSSASSVAKRTVIVIHPPLTEKETKLLALQLDCMRRDEKPDLLIPVPARQQRNFEVAGYPMDVEEGPVRNGANRYHHTTPDIEDIETSDDEQMNSRQLVILEDQPHHIEDTETSDDITDYQTDVLQLGITEGRLHQITREIEDTEASDDDLEIVDDQKDVDQVVDDRLGDADDAFPLSSLELGVDIPPFPMPPMRVPFTVNANRLLRLVSQTDCFREFDEVVATYLQYN